MWATLGIKPIEAVAVSLGALGIYLAILFLIRLLGQRSVASMTDTDTAAIVLLGAVGGRAVLGYTPTLVAGVIGLVTLFIIRLVVAWIRRYSAGMWVVGNRPILLMADGRIIEANLARTRIRRIEIYSKLRAAGVLRRDEVACAILEPTGDISILKHTDVIDPVLLESVVGREEIPPTMIAGSH